MFNGSPVFHYPSTPIALAQCDLASARMEWSAIDTEQALAADEGEWSRADELGAMKEHVTRRILDEIRRIDTTSRRSRFSRRLTTGS